MIEKGDTIEITDKVLIAILIISKFQYMCTTAAAIFVIPAKVLLKNNIIQWFLYFGNGFFVITSQSFMVFLILLTICWQCRTYVMISSEAS